jgi:hypothetical protein
MASVMTTHHFGIWQRQSDQAIHIPNMNMSNLVSSYDPSQNVNTPPTSRAFQTTNAQIEMHMPLFSAHPLVTSVPYQSGAFAFDHMSANPYNLQQTFPVNYQSVPPHTHGYPGTTGAAHIATIQRNTPPVKVEATSPTRPTQMCADRSYDTDRKSSVSDAGSSSGIDFSTPVDTMMKAIQAKQQPAPQQCQSPSKVCDLNRHKVVEARDLSKCQEEAEEKKPSRKKYQCHEPGCRKTFQQKTHLNIHIRKHSGEKPFVCKLPSCGQRFTQLGNLKTHERRHTGERPYICELCGKSFAQRGNVNAHKVVHQRLKPFTCRLDECASNGKHFTQLGNLKSHQNKFHANTIRHLTQKFANISDSDIVTDEEKKLWEYFASLYKNSNKGIKGRGKGKRIAGTASASNPLCYPDATASSPIEHYAGSYQHSNSDRSSRGSSLSSDATHRVDDSYDFNTTMADAYSNHHAYCEPVFPERQMYRA